MEHAYSFTGRYVRVQLGRFGYGSGHLGLVGSSTVQLATTGRTTDDLVGGEAVAIVFDVETATGLPDVLRVFVPSEASIKESLVSVITSAAGLSARVASWPELPSVVLNSLSTDVGYVSDRLSALVRMGKTANVRFDVVGLALRPQMMLGGALRIVGEDRWMQLYPMGLLEALRAAIA